MVGRRSEAVVVVGGEQLLRRLERLPEGWPRLLQHVASYLRERGRVYARPHPADRGTLGEAITVEQRGPLAFSTGIHRRMQIAWTVHDGNPPGSRYSWRRIDQWRRSHGITTPLHRLVRTMEQRGTKGIRFLDRAQDDTVDALPSLVREWLAKERGGEK